jgi:hypothetical protein
MNADIDPGNAGVPMTSVKEQLPQDRDLRLYRSIIRCWDCEYLCQYSTQNRARKQAFSGQQLSVVSEGNSV